MRRFVAVLLLALIATTPALTLRAEARIDDWGGTLSDIGSDIWDAIKGFLTEIWNGIKDKASEIINTIIDYFLAPWQAAIDIIQGFGESVKNQLSNTLQQYPWIMLAIVLFITITLGMKLLRFI